MFETGVLASSASPCGLSGASHAALEPLLRSALCLRSLPESLLRSTLEPLLRSALCLRSLPEALLRTAPEPLLRTTLENLLRTALCLRSLPEALLRPALEAVFHALVRTLFHALFRSILGVLFHALFRSVLGSLRKTVPQFVSPALTRGGELSACAGHGASPHASGSRTHSTCRCGLCDSHPGRSRCCLSQNGVGRSQPGEGDPDGGECHELIVHSCLRWFGGW